MHVALYYPFVAPPDAWAKKSLLLFDAVATVVPPDYEATVMPSNPLLAFLKREELWRPQFVQSVPNIEGYLNEISELLAEFAVDPRYIARGRPPLHEDARARDFTQVYVGKLGNVIESLLGELGLSATRAGPHGHLLVHSEVASALLAVTARHLAADSAGATFRLAVSTDSGLAHRSAFAPLDLRNRAECAALLLDGFLPEPDPATSIEEVVDFRDKHREEVMELRVALNTFVSRVVASADPPATFGDCIDELDAARQRLASSARRTGVILRTGQVVALLGGGALAATHAAGQAALWGFQGAGVAIVSEFIRRIADAPQRPDPFAYLHKARQTFAP